MLAPGTKDSLCEIESQVNIHWSCVLQIANFEETLAVLKQSPPDRIGHGTFLHRYQPGQGHEEIEDIVLASKIPIGKIG